MAEIWKEWKFELAALGVIVLFLVLLFSVLVPLAEAERRNREQVGIAPLPGASGVWRDNVTRCQYLRSGLSGLTPRLDGEGRHVGCATPAAAGSGG